MTSVSLTTRTRNLTCASARLASGCWLTSKTIPDYYPRSTVTGLFQQYVNYGRGRARTTLKHPALPSCARCFPSAYCRPCCCARRADLPAGCDTRPHTGSRLCLVYGLAIGMRERSVAAALSGPMAMVIHFGWSVDYWDFVVRSMLGGNR